ncbi:AMP deaminase putative / myoadenylate deaminase putative [Euphorbia peplus]|nr:AMP deaminase putative / myoadenylate deaminase putative [Euphorbia peplus]
MYPVASASAFESIEGSDEEDNMTDISKLDTAYLHTNETVEANTLIDSIPNGEQFPIPASSMIRSYSGSGDLHVVQPDPIAADILRKSQSMKLLQDFILLLLLDWI